MPDVTFIPAQPKATGKTKSKSKKKIRVAAYARVSTDHEDQLNSFEAQVTYFTELIEGRDDWEMVKIYADEGESGLSIKRRKDFQQMIADAIAGKIDLIVSKSISRISRNTVDVLQTVRKLKEKGVEIWFQKENLWSLDPQVEFLLAIMSSIAQEESRSTSKNVIWGHQRRMAKGKVSVAYSNFLGYDKGPDGTLVINPEQAEVVKLIYSDFLKGLSYAAIGRHLTMLGIKTPMGKDNWGIGTVQRVLTNEKYKGDALLGKTYTPDFLTKKQVKNTGQSPQYYVTGCHEAIIEPRLFDRVQEEVAARAEGKKSGLTIFSSKIYCGDCGRRYGPKVHHSNDKYRKVVWRCNGKYEGNQTCGTPLISEDEIKDAFLSVLNRMLMNREESLVAVADAMKQVGDVERLEEKKRELSKEIKELAVSINNSKDSDEYYEEMFERHNQLSIALKEVMSEIQAKRIWNSNVERFIALMKKLPDKVKNFDEILWASFIEKVTVYGKDDIRFTLVTGEELKA